MILFFVKNLKKGTSHLEEDEFIHCIKVLKRKVGDIIHVTDGQGHFSEGEILTINKNKAELNIGHISEKTKKINHITLAIAPPKNRSRWEWLIEKSVEIGVDEIIPIRTKNSERLKLNIERAKKIIRSAALQSLRYHHPVISEIQNFKDIILSPYEEKFVAHYHPDNSHLKNHKTSSNQQLILIGPEGDFEKQEIKDAVKQGFNAVNISDNRLRTETAGIVALNLLVNL